MANVVPLLVCLLLALCTLSLSADDHLLVSIDCGSSSSSDPYRDENGIVWTGDDEYVKSGESRSVQVPFNSSSFSVMDTLRVFNNNKTKNCYTINSLTPGQRVLLRPSFYYGNYDGKNSPPTFDFMFDGTYWGTVNMSANPTGTREEVIYVPNKESISLCVAQTFPDHFPFMSALEIRSLEASMYTAVKDNVQLYTTRRVGFGANQTIRFPEDPYDRIWDGVLPLPNMIQVSGDAVLSSGLTKDNPPPAVLKTAITNTSTPNTTINLYMGGGSDSFSFYINMYFSEVTRLNPNQTRSFYVYKDNRPFSTPILPPYGNCTQFVATNVTILPNTTFSLVPTSDSTLLPLINAMEVFLLYEPKYDATNNKDVQGLASLQETFSSLQDWSGDPCLPAGYKYAWNWVKCDTDVIPPRVTTLLLGGYGLSGLLPDFSSMDALQTINLSNNSLRGEVPDFLGTFPNLQILNLENNQFTGTIPASLSTKKGLILRVSGNPGLCASNTSCSVSAPAPKANSSARKKKKKILETLFAAIIPFIIVLQLS